MRGTIAVAAAGLLASGCFAAPETRTYVGSPRIASGAEAQVFHFRRASPTDVGDECRDQVAMVHDVATVRRADIDAQIGNVAGAILFAGGGIAGFFPVCRETTTLTSGVGSSSSRNVSCWVDSHTHNATLVVVGLTLIGIGAVYSAAFISNEHHAETIVEVKPTEPMFTPWTACPL